MPSDFLARIPIANEPCAVDADATGQQVQKHVVSQAALAADLCSRCIIRGRADADGDDSDGYGPKLVASLPDFLHSPSKQALDAVFPPLDAIETAQREIALWFSEAELVAWEEALNPWLYEL